MNKIRVGNRSMKAENVGGGDSIVYNYNFDELDILCLQSYLGPRAPGYTLKFITEYSSLDETSELYLQFQRKSDEDEEVLSDEDVKFMEEEISEYLSLTPRRFQIVSFDLHRYSFTDEFLCRLFPYFVFIGYSPDSKISRPILDTFITDTGIQIGLNPDLIWTSEILSNLQRDFFDIMNFLNSIIESVNYVKVSPERREIKSIYVKLNDVKFRTSINMKLKFGYQDEITSISEEIPEIMILLNHKLEDIIEEENLEELETVEDLVQQEKKSAQDARELSIMMENNLPNLYDEPLLVDYLKDIIPEEDDEEILEEEEEILISEELRAD